MIPDLAISHTKKNAIKLCVIIFKISILHKN